MPSHSARDWIESNGTRVTTPISGIFICWKREAMIQRIKGTQDLLPGEIEKWQYLEEKAREIFARYGYSEIRTPIFEETELFARSIGTDTDIVEKEMYTFADRNKKSLTLRPEGTAPVVRASIENNLLTGSGTLKLFYVGPMFRHERPQKGRYRQFHQIG